MVEATGSDTALLRDPPHTDQSRRARGNRTLTIKQVSSAFQQSQYVATDIRSAKERTDGEPARFASTYQRRHPHFLVAFFADVAGDDPSSTIDPRTPRITGYPLMTPLADGDASQGYLSDIALMNTIEHDGEEATIRLTADPHYRIDPPMEPRAVGRFSPEALRHPSVGEMGHDLLQFLASIDGTDVDTEVDALRTAVENLSRGYSARSGGTLPLILQIFKQIMPQRANPVYEENQYPAYRKD